MPNPIYRRWVEGDFKKMKNLCCPKCGGPVFEPMLIEDSWYPKGTLMCKKYGHWTGLAKEAKQPSPKESKWEWWHNVSLELHP